MLLLRILYTLRILVSYQISDLPILSPTSWAVPHFPHFLNDGVLLGGGRSCRGTEIIFANALFSTGSLPRHACLTTYDPADCSPPGSSAHGILQARRLEWGAISFSRGSSQPRTELTFLASPALAGGCCTPMPLLQG